MESDALSSFRDPPPEISLRSAEEEGEAGKASAIDCRFQYSPMQRWHAKLKVVVSGSELQLKLKLKCCNIAPSYSAIRLNQQTHVKF